MTLTLSATAPAALATDALVIGVLPKGKGKALQLAAHGLTAAQQAKVLAALTALGATGKPGEVIKLPGITGIKAPVIVGLGIGDVRTGFDAESLRRSVGTAIRALAGRKRVAIIAAAEPVMLKAIAEGASLAAYDFTAFKSKKGIAPVGSITLLIGCAPTPELKALITDVEVITNAVHLARDLVNTPPNALPPAVFAAQAKAAMAGLPVKVAIWDEKELARQECGGILAVGMGSANPPRMVRLEYAPAGARGHIALVGKGVTFDTGGISIKPASKMDEMKGDMGGAAAVIAAVAAIARLELPIKVTGWAPMAENMPSGDAQRPGDVITMHGGKTVEVLNTDAEGRLLLADALGLAAAEKPDLIVDAATLTGAQRVALGSRIAGVMGNDDEARAAVCVAAEVAGEAAWPMPLPEDLRPALDSATADLANIGEPFGGMLSAGVFLAEFVPAGRRWVHLDIAGPSFNDKGAYGYTPKGGTGSAVRTFVQVAKDSAAG